MRGIQPAVILQQESMEEETPNQPPTTNYCQILGYTFKLKWKLGEGSFATVYRGIDSDTDSEVAIKIIELKSLTSKVSISLLKQEVLILKQLQHPNIIKCHKVINSDSHLYIVTEFCKFGDLQNLLKIKGKFTEEEVGEYVYQIYKGLRYLSERNIIHRDIKPANVFVSEHNQCKIADFGFAAQSKEKFTDVSMGSPYYMTPESIHAKEYGPKTDVWAFGVLIYELISGFPPLSGCQSKEELRERVLMEPKAIKEPITAELHSFIRGCLTIEEKSRTSVAEMQHTPYMQRLTAEYESAKNLSASSFSDTKYSTKSSCFLFRTAMKKPISYEEAVSLLQYCRLLAKICQIIPEKSGVLEQWLLITIKGLHRADLCPAPSNSEQLKATIKQYYTRYKTEFKDRVEFKDRAVSVRIDEVIVECDNQLPKNRKLQKHIQKLLEETELLKASLNHPLKLVFFARQSTVSQYLNQVTK